MDPNHNYNQESNFLNRADQSQHIIDNNINRTPENNFNKRRSSIQNPQVSVPATPRMLSNSFRHSSAKRTVPETPPKQQQNPQFSSQNQMYYNNMASNTVTNNHNTTGSHRTNPSGDTAISKGLFSPTDNLRKERSNYRSEFNTSNSSNSPTNNTFNRLNNDKRRGSQSSERANNDLFQSSYNPNVPIIKINRDNESSEEKGFNFIEAYEQDHKKDGSLMPPLDFAGKPQNEKRESQQYPVVVPSTPVKERVFQSPGTQHNITPKQPLMPDVFDRLQNVEEKKTVVENGKKYKEFHRKSIGDWEFVGSIGSGSMGKVKVAKNTKTGELCAVKIVTRAVKTFLYKCERDQAFKDSLTSDQYREKLLKENSRDKRTIREGGLGQIFYHPNICRLFHIWGLTTHYYMLFEYVKGGQLLDYIIQHGSLKEHRVRKFSRGIASAIKYLHGHNIVHRDLKIENILISESGEIKIIDFGLSNFYDINDKLKTFCGSLYFAAPELLKAEPYVGPEVDIWAFGVVMYVLLCGKVPFDNDRSDVLHRLIKEGKVEYPSHISPSVKSLLQRMLIVDRKQRFSIDEIVNHPWMNMGYDYKVLNHIPPRKPLHEIDYHVCEEMVRLFFYDDANELYANLSTMIQSKEYLELTKLHYDMFGTDLPNNNDDDPLLAFHADISLYHLVDEFFDRKDIVRAEEKVVNARGVAAENGKYFQFMNAGLISSPTQKVQKSVKVSPEHPYQKHRVDVNTMKEKQVQQAQQIADYKNQKNDLRSPVKAHLAEPKQRKPSQPLSSGLGLLSPLKAEDNEPRPRIASENIVYDLNQGQESDKFTFGSLFRRLSSGRKKSADTSSQSKPDQWKRSHKRTVSEGVPMSSKYNNDDHRYDVDEKFPALPVNAHLLVKREQIRYNLMNDSNTNAGNESVMNPSDKSSQSSQATEKKSVASKRMHPNARAKSVGSNAMVSEMINPSSKQSQKSSMAADFRYMSGDEVLAEAAKAPKGSMPSIEHPKVFFLKNFFSVQTTSFLPLPLVRYEIMRVLSEMSIDFKEVSGGFMCTFTNKVEKPATDTLEDITAAYLDEEESDEDADKSHEGYGEVEDYDTGRNNMSRRGSVMKNAYRQQIPQTPKVLSRSSESGSWNTSYNQDESGIMETPRSVHQADVSLDYDNNSSDEMRADFKKMNIDKNSKSRMLITDDSTYNHSVRSSEKNFITFEVLIVKIPVIGTPGVHMKKIKGNTWYFKALASRILENLNL